MRKTLISIGFFNLATATVSLVRMGLALRADDMAAGLYLVFALTCVSLAIMSFGSARFLNRRKNRTRQQTGPPQDSNVIDFTRDEE